MAIVHSFYSSRVPSGENLMVHAQIKALKKFGHDVELFSIDSDSSLETPVQTLQAAAKVAFGYGLSPLRALKKFKPQLIIVNNLFPNYGSSWLSKINVPKIAYLHNYRYLCANGVNFRDGHQCFDCTEKSALSSLKNSCYKDSVIATLPLTIAQLRRPFLNNEFDAFDRFIALSDGAKDIFQRGGIPMNKLIVIPNYIETHAIEFSSEISSKNGKWVTAGRLSREKGFLNLVRAWPNSEQLDIIGNGPDEELIRKEIGSRTNIKLSGLLSRDEIMNILPKYVGAIHPSLWQEFPLVAIESISCGLPLITLKDNTASKFVQNTNSGLVIKEFTTNTLSDCINEICSNYDFFSKSARESFLNNFTEKVWVERINHLFQSLVEETLIL